MIALITHIVVTYTQAVRGGGRAGWWLIDVIGHIKPSKSRWPTGLRKSNDASFAVIIKCTYRFVEPALFVLGVHRRIERLNINNSKQYKGKGLTDQTNKNKNKN